MNLHLEKIEKLSLLVIDILYKRFDNFPKDALLNRNAPFHEAFLNAFSDEFNEITVDIPFFISLSSWLHGLNTTLGQSFFEKAAQILSDGDKREYTSKKRGNLKISRAQKNNVNTIMTNLSNSAIEPNAEEENELLFVIDNSDRVNAIDFSCDIFVEDINEIVAIELKSVRPNSGEMHNEKRKILEGKTALFEKFPGKIIKFYLGFPFDPTSIDRFGKDKERFTSTIINCNKYFDSKEILLADELWDLLSGKEKTMEQLIEIINSIATPEFLSRFDYINDKSNKLSNEYMKYLTEWNLYSEIHLLNNENIIQEKINGDRGLNKIYNQNIFKNSSYNWSRYYKLKELLQ